MDAQCKAALQSPLKGKYLIQNPVANWTFRLMDAGLSLWTWRAKRDFPIPQPRKILLSNLAHLGDVVLMTSLLPAIKQAIPGVKIGVVVGSWSQKMVQGHPLIDYVHLLDHWKIARTDADLFQKIRKTNAMSQAVREELRQIRYDISVECSFHFPNAIALSYLAGIPVRIGYTSGGFGPLLTHSVDWTEKRESVASYALSLISKFAIVDSNQLKPTLPIRSAIPCTVPKDFIVVHVGSGNPIKEWPIEKWKELCKKLVDAGHYLVFTGKGKRELDAIQCISSGLKNSLNLCDRLSWEECITLIKTAKALIGVDSGAGHVAAATDTPAILLFTGIHPIELWKPLSAKAHALIHPVPCHPCHLNRGCESMQCIRNIGVETVFTAIEQII